MSTENWRRLVMEHVRGKALDELIPRHGLRLGDALKYAVQIADALAKAHTAGIVHRDSHSHRTRPEETKREAS